MPLFDCEIVLVRPRDPNNIGATARAMKNFGFHDLWIVAPYPPVWNEVVSAVNAEDLLAKAHVTSTLAEAVADCTLVVGTADRTRVEEKQTVYTPADLSRQMQETSDRLALVFGSEKHGLTNDDLSHCNHIMSIPTRPDCPSMNLGQAVAVCCYEFTRMSPEQAIVPPGSERATAGAMEAAVGLSLDVLGLIEFILPGNEPELKRRLRRTLMRLNMTRYDVDMMCGILSRIKRELQSIKQQ